MVFAPKEGIHRRVEVLLIIYIYILGKASERVVQIYVLYVFKYVLLLVLLQSFACI